MNRYLREFTTYINDTYEEIEPEKKKIFKSYFSDPLMVKKILDDGSDGTDICDFLKKINVEIKNLEAFEGGTQEIFFNELLFERNSQNIKLYSRLHRKDGYLFNCYLENEKILRYVTRDNSALEVLVKSVLDEAVGEVHEDPKFLLLLLYTPSFDEPLRQSFLSQIQDECLDYVDVFSMPKPWEQYIDIEMGTDSLCRTLIVQHKLKKTWNNILFSFRQVDDDGEIALVDYINNLSRNEYDILNLEHNVHKRLNDVVKKFLLFIFEKPNVNTYVLKSFVSVIKENDLFFVPDVFFEKYIADDEKSIENEYKRWNTEKCAEILKFFFRMSFRSSYKYTKLIYYLVKSNPQEVFSCLDKNVGEIRTSRKESFYIYFSNRNRKNLFVNIYASLLSYTNEEKDDGSLNYREVEFLLERMDLDVLDDVIDAWKNSFPENLLKKSIRNVLNHEDWIYHKLREQHGKTQQIESLHFLNGLINFVEKQWMARTIKYMESQGLLSKENVSGSEAFLGRYNMYYDAIYKYAFG